MFDVSTQWMIIGALLGAAYPIGLYLGDRHLSEQRKRKRIKEQDPDAIRPTEHIGLTSEEWRRWIERDELIRQQVHTVAHILLQQGAKKVLIHREGMIEPLAVIDGA